MNSQAKPRELEIRHICDSALSLKTACFDKRARRFFADGFCHNDQVEMIELVYKGSVVSKALTSKLVEPKDNPPKGIKINSFSKWTVIWNTQTPLVIDEPSSLELKCRINGTEIIEEIDYDLIVQMEFGRDCSGDVSYKKVCESGKISPQSLFRFEGVSCEASPQTPQSWYEREQYVPERGLVYVENAFFSSLSLVWNSDGFLFRDAFRGYPNDHDFVFRASRDEAFRISDMGGFRFCLSAPKPTIRLPGQYLHIGCRPREPFGHWMLEYFTRLWCLPHLPSHVKILIPEGTPSFILKHLEMVGLEDRLFFYNPKQTYQCDQIIVPSPSACHNKYFGSGINEFLDVIRPSIRGHLMRNNATAESENCAAMIYIARTDVPGKRSFVSENELIYELENRGFQILVPGHMDELEKIMAFACAKVIVAPIGSGLANLLFAMNHPEVVVLSPHLLPDRFVSDLSSYIRSRVSYVFGKSHADNTRDSWSASWEINVERTVEVIDEIISAVDERRA